jgi:hypothetical protein
MNLHVFLFLFMLSLAQLCHLYWSHHCSPRSRAAAKLRTRVQRLLKPRSPLDCPACRLASPLSSGVEPAPLPVRPWREMKSRRGAPKRVNTEGFACPNRKCPYSGITDAHIHAPLWGWQAWPGRADPDLSRSRLPHHFQCSMPHSLVSFENHLSTHRDGADLARASGLDPSEASRVFGYRQATITSLSDARGLACANLARALASRNLQLPHLQLDELRTRLRSYKQVLWLWLAIDPCTKILPVLHLGPRTQNMAHLLIHSLRRILAAFLPPTLHE